MKSLFDFLSSILVFLLKGLFSSEDKLRRENLMLRHQIKVLKTNSKTRVKFRWLDRLLFVTVSTKKMRNVCLIFRPETLYKWHKELIRRRWTYASGNTPGRPRTRKQIEQLVLRLKRDNRLWGVPRIHGELWKLGIRISKSTVRNILKRHGLGPCNEGENYLTWSQFLRQHKSVWAIDFFTVETIFLKRVYIFAIIDIHTRELIDLRVCMSPFMAWTRNILLHHFGFENSPDLIIRDGDPQYGNLTRVGGVKVKKIPPGCPWFNGYAERVIGSVQRECTNHFLYFTPRQIQKSLNEYREYYNQHRPHQSLDQSCPVPATDNNSNQKFIEKVTSTEILGGLHHRYSNVG